MGATAPLTAHASAGARNPSSYFVVNCDDTGPGSLRWALEWVKPGDTVDLSLLRCTIALSGPLFTSDDDIVIAGPGADALTISGSHAGRVIEHHGGSLTMSGVTIADGYYEDDLPVFGGCVYASGDVHLVDTVVTGCGAKDTSSEDASNGCGGAVFTSGALTVERSRVVGNYLSVQPASYSFGSGAGLCSQGPLVLSQSVVSGNELRSPGSSDFAGAGIYTKYGATITGSTIASNAGGAIWLLKGESRIDNSTISGNTGGGILVQEGGLAVHNSTIAFNSVGDASAAGGIDFDAQGFGLFVESSIVAANQSLHVPLDISAPASVTVGGAKNLIVAATAALPADTIADDPMLAPLAGNGGPTPTHALLPGSPAHDAGDNVLGFDTDQRGFARVVGDAADIGAFETQDADALFSNGFD